MTISELNRQLTDFFVIAKGDTKLMAHGLCYYYKKGQMGEWRQVGDHSTDKVSWQGVAYNNSVDVQWYWTGGDTVIEVNDNYDYTQHDRVQLVVSASSMNYKNVFIKWLNENRELMYRGCVQNSPQLLFEKYWLMPTTPDRICFVFDINLYGVDWGSFCETLPTNKQEICESE
jgi:hypothetical protein